MNSSFPNLDSFFTDSESAKIDKLLINTILKRKALLSNNNLDGCREYNKNIHFNFESLEILDNSALCTFTVTKTFNYGFSLDIETEFIDYYSLELIKENEIWLINDIDGLVDIILKETFVYENVNIEDEDSLLRYNQVLTKVITEKDLSIKTAPTNLINFDQLTIHGIASVSYDRSGAVAYALNMP